VEMDKLSKKRSVGKGFKGFEIQKYLAPAALVILYIFFGIFGRNFF